MPAQQRIVPMRVLILGVHRTGTLSLRHALRQLGFHDCYHMHSVTEDRSRASTWTRAIEAKYGSGNAPFTREDWDTVLYDCQAVCDLPAAFFGAELAAAYPEAKVVILNREPEAWHKSVQETFGMMQKRSMFQIVKIMVCALLDRETRDFVFFSKAMRTKAMGFDQVHDKDKALEWFRNQYAEFRENVEPERRIEYSVKDGWGPLCDHLGVPVPMVKGEDGQMVEAPFPRLNDRDTFLAKYDSMLKVSVRSATDKFLMGVGKLTLLGSVAYGAYRLARRF